MGISNINILARRRLIFMPLRTLDKHPPGFQGRMWLSRTSRPRVAQAQRGRRAKPHLGAQVGTAINPPRRLAIHGLVALGHGWGLGHQGDWATTGALGNFSRTLQLACYWRNFAELFGNPCC